MKYINNRKARFSYFVEERYRAGIVLTGSEVKSIRAGHCGLTESFGYFRDGELFIRNMNIPAFNNRMFSHDENRERKLLLSKKELRSIAKKLQIKGYTLIPLSVEIPDTGFIKVSIGVCKGKHNYDKRNSLKERDAKRDLETR